MMIFGTRCCSWPSGTALLLSLLVTTPVGGRQEDTGASRQNIMWGQAETGGAHFDTTTPTNITAVMGHRAVLPCTVRDLGQKDISWIRKRDLHILTIKEISYTSDERFSVLHNKDDWNLTISSVTFRDAGIYECQISTSPKISRPINLHVEVQQAQILGSSEVFVKNGSTISLTCHVTSQSENFGAVAWYRDKVELDYDSPRGGVSLEIEKKPHKTTTKLFITRAVKADSGNYSCVPENADAAHVIVHVVSGEESAEVKTGASSRPYACDGIVLLTVSVLLLLLIQTVDASWYIRILLLQSDVNWTL
ncbi:unnamed protein product, partial [Meganyctiphanes norvegica]